MAEFVRCFSQGCLSTGRFYIWGIVGRDKHNNLVVRRGLACDRHERHYAALNLEKPHIDMTKLPLLHA